MGLLDKVKEAATQVGGAAKKGAAQVQSKVEHSQTRKKADDAAKRLGYLIVKERTEGTPAGEEADNLVSEIVGLEKQLTEETAADEGQAEAAADDEPNEGGGGPTQG